MYFGRLSFFLIRNGHQPGCDRPLRGGEFRTAIVVDGSAPVDCPKDQRAADLPVTAGTASRHSGASVRREPRAEYRGEILAHAEQPGPIQLICALEVAPQQWELRGLPVPPPWYAQSLPSHQQADAGLEFDLIRRGVAGLDHPAARRAPLPCGSSAPRPAGCTAPVAQTAGFNSAIAGLFLKPARPRDRSAPRVLVEAGRLHEVVDVGSLLGQRGRLDLRRGFALFLRNGPD
ncbi:MAG: hypothetical protein KGL43_21915 [Burkholderiales bacterium]|nr:hypothetical protein [Burkholderiales bacterium]MDE2396338.1 hypothetical protein [Burkholderiales bacterium]MDE2456253.1 hypothetical protein [Burkholderiales bacterium]